MAKRKKSKPVQSGDDGFANNPFASALSGLDRAPAAATPKPAEPKTKDSGTSAPKRAVVRLEKKGRGGKKVTVVSHLGLSSSALAEWAESLRKKLGCGGAVEGDKIVLQGDQRDRAASALEARGVRKVTKS